MNKKTTKTVKRLTSGERRDSIINAAGVLFAQKGLHGVTTKEIAKASGVSEPVLYQHFKSKEEIYEGLNSLCQGQTVGIKRLMNSLPRSTESLCLFVYTLTSVISLSTMPTYKRSDVPETLTRLSTYSLLEDGRFMNVLIRDCIGALFTEWQENYAAALKAGDLEGVDGNDHELWLAYMQILGLSMFQLQTTKVLSQVQKDKKYLDKSVLFMLRGLGLKEKAIQKNYKPQEWLKSLKFSFN